MARRSSRLLTPQGRSPQPGVIQSTMLGLYIHVPFCSAICNYCNFNRGLFDAALKTRYVEALATEICRKGGVGADLGRPKAGASSAPTPGDHGPARAGPRFKADTLYF